MSLLLALVVALSTSGLTPLVPSIAAQGLATGGNSPVHAEVAPAVDGILVKYRGEAQTHLAAMPPGPNRGLAQVELRLGESLQEKLAALRANPDVEYAEPNYVLVSQSAPNDPLYADQWALTSIGAQSAIQLLKAHLEGADPRPVTVAVLDTGVEGTHEDLVGRVIAGYDAIVGAAIAPGTNSDDSYSSHGTMVAGIIAATTNNAAGIAGVAGEFPVSVIPVKVLDRSGHGTMLNIINGIYWAVDNGADIINMSFGARLPDYPLALAEAIAHAQHSGVMVVAAAGNEARRYDGFYPASLSGVLVAAAQLQNASNVLAGFSNTASSYRGPAFLLPGVDLLTTQRDDSYGLFAGTSVSAAVLAGAVALLRSCAVEERAIEHVLYGLERHAGSSSSRFLLDGAATQFTYYSVSTPDYTWIAFDSIPDTVMGMVRLPATILEGDTLVDSVSFYYHSGAGDWSTFDSEPKVLLGTVANSADRSRQRYEITWDTTTVPDGMYTVWAAINSDCEYPDYDYVHIYVFNEAASGLAISVRRPDNTPAAQAVISIWHAFERDGQPYYESVLSDLGTTDLSGDLIVSGLVATDGHEYLITARGADYYYTTRVTAPAQVSLGGSSAVEIRLTADDGATALTGATVQVSMPLLDAQLIGGFRNSDARKRVTAELGAVALGQLGAGGRGSVWLGQGEYHLYLVDAQQLYVVARQVTVPGDVAHLSLNLAGEISVAVPLTLVPGPDDAPDYLELHLDLADADGMGRMITLGAFAPGRPVYVTPASYSLVGTAYYRSAANPDRYYLTRHALGHQIVTDETALAIGGLSAGLRYQLDYLEPIGSLTAGDPLAARLRLLDSAGNPVVATGQLDMFREPDGAWIVRNSYGGAPQPYLWRWANGAWQNLTSADMDEASFSLRTGEHTYRFDPYWTRVAGEYRLTAGISFLDLIPGGGAQPELAFAVVGAGPAPPNLLITGTLDGVNPWGAPGDYPGIQLQALAPTGVYELYQLSDYDLAWNEFGRSYWQSGLKYEIGRRLYEQVPFSPDQPLAVMVYGKQGTKTGTYDHYALLYSLFTLAELPYDAATNTYTLALDGSLQQLVETQLTSADQTGASLDDPAVSRYERRRSRYWLSWSDEQGHPLEVFLDSYRVATWLPNATDYLVRSTYIAGVQGQEAYEMRGSLDIAGVDPASAPVQLTLGGPSLKRLTIEVSGHDPLSAYRVWGAGLSPCGTARPTMPVWMQSPQPLPSGFEMQSADLPQQDQFVIWVTPGEYALDTIMARYHVSGGWAYRFASQVDLTTAGATLIFSDEYQAQLDAERLAVGIGEDLALLPVVTDGQGNRLAAIARVPMDYDAWDFSIQSHPYIAPFIVIQSADGREVLRYKQADETLYHFLRALSLSGSDGSQQVLMPASQSTTFFCGEATGLPAGAYLGRLELGASPEGIISSEPTLMLVSSALAAALLGPARPTSELQADVKGVTWPDASVSVSYQVDGGMAIALPPVTAGPNGAFAVTIPLSTEGTYAVSAQVVLGQEQGVSVNTAIIVADRTPPSQPANLRSTGQDETTLRLSWDAATDCLSGVAAYIVCREGILLAELEPGVHQYQDTGLVAGADYLYAVYARDGAGNLSEPALVTGNTSDEGDIEPPTPPLNLAGEARDGTVVLDWQAATDNIEVVGYIVYRRAPIDGEFAEVARVTGLTYTDRGLAFSSAYYYQVAAYDAAGNVSEPSNSVEVTTGPIAINEVRLTLPRNSQGYATSRQGSLVLYGSAGAAVASVAIDYTAWDGPDSGTAVPVAGTATLGLAEGPEGLYATTFTLPERTSSVDQITVTLADEGTGLAQRTVLRAPVVMAGAMEVELVLDPTLYGDYTDIYQQALAGLASSRLELYSVFAGFAAGADTANGPGTYLLERLSPADDYTLRLRDAAGDITRQVSGLTVSPGLANASRLELVPESSLEVRVTDSGGQPLSGLRLQVRDAGGQVLALGTAGQDGWVRRAGTTSLELASGIVSGAAICLEHAGWTSEFMAAWYQPLSPVTMALVPGQNSIPISLERISGSSVLGQVVDSATGAPLANVTVELTSAGVTSSTLTDGQGNFAFTQSEVPANATATLAARCNANTHNPASMLIAAADLGQTHILRLERKVYTDIRLNIQANMIKNGSEYYPINDARNGLMYITSANARLSVRVGHRSAELLAFPVYRVPLSVAPGQPITVSVDGRSYGLDVVTATGTVNQDHTAQVNVNLRERNRLDIVFTDEQGMARAGTPRMAILFAFSQAGVPFMAARTEFEGSKAPLHTSSTGHHKLVLAWGMPVVGWEQERLGFWEGQPEDGFRIIDVYVAPGEPYAQLIRAEIAQQFRLFVSRIANHLLCAVPTQLPTGGVRLKVDAYFSSRAVFSTVTNMEAHLTLPPGVIVTGVWPTGLAVTTDHVGQTVISLPLATTPADGRIQATIEVAEAALDGPLFAGMTATYTVDGIPHVELIRHEAIETANIEVAVPEAVAASDLVWLDDLPAGNLGGVAAGGVPVRVTARLAQRGPFELQIYDGAHLLYSTALQDLARELTVYVNLPKAGVPNTHYLWAKLLRVNWDDTITEYTSASAPVRVVGDGEPRLEYITLVHHNMKNTRTFTYTQERFGVAGDWLDWNNLNLFSFEAKFANSDRLSEVVVGCTTTSQFNQLILTYDPGRDVFYGSGPMGDFYNPPGDFWVKYYLREYGEDRPYSPPPLGPAPDQESTYWAMGEGLRSSVITAEEREPQYGDTVGPGPVDIDLLFDDNGIYTLPTVTIVGPGAEDYQVSAEYYLLDTSLTPAGAYVLPLATGESAYLDIQDDGGHELVYTIYAPLNYLLPEALPGEFGSASWKGAFTDVAKAVYKGYKTAKPGYELASTAWDIMANGDDLTQTMQDIDWLEAHYLGYGGCSGMVNNMMQGVIENMRDGSNKFALLRNMTTALGYAAPGVYNGYAASMAGNIVGGFQSAFMTRDMDMLAALSEFGYDECHSAPGGDCMPGDPGCGGGGAGAGAGAGGGRVGGGGVFTKPSYKIDPSGYVFEAVEGNRIADVYATVFYRNTEGAWLPWDSEAYDEGPNPQATGPDGRYGWDVLIGEWQVLYEKEGYHTTFSEALPVPPPHTDVNISLVSLAAPEVDRAYAGSGGAYIHLGFSRYMLLDTVCVDTVTVTHDGQPVAGSVIAVDAALSASGNKQLASAVDTVAGVPLASQFRFVPEEILQVGETYTVTVSGEAVAYNGRTLPDGGFEATLTVPEIASVPLERLAFTGDDLLLLAQGQAINLYDLLEIYPDDASTFGINWHTSRPCIAPVTAGGLVTGISTGYAQITAESSAGHVITKTIGVYRGHRLTADPSLNTVMFCSDQLAVGKTCGFKAMGDRQPEHGQVAGDERYIPTSWTMEGAYAASGSWPQPSYQVIFAPTEPGTLTTTVTFRLQTWTGSSWMDTGIADTKSFTRQVSAGVAPVQSTYQLSADLAGLTFVAGSATGTAFSLGISADQVGDHGIERARLNVTLLSGPDGAIATVLAEGDSGAAYDVLAQGFWGLADGFALTAGHSETVEFVVRFDTAGQYQIGFTLVDLGDESAPVASLPLTFSVASPANQPPVLVPVGDKTVGEGQTLTFTVVATDPDGDELTYSGGNLPVGATINAQSGVFSWVTQLGDAGTYPGVVLSASDGMETASETIGITVTPTSLAPAASFTVDPATPAAGQAVWVDAGSSHHPHPSHTIVLYEWDWDYDGTSLQVAGSGVTASHTYPSTGCYVIALRVTDDLGATVLATRSVTVTAQQAPVANAGGPYELTRDGDVRLDGSGSYDPEAQWGDEIVSYVWDIDGNGVFGDLAGVAPLLTWAHYCELMGLSTCPAPSQTQSIWLKVTDTTGLWHVAQATLTVYCPNRPPQFAVSGPWTVDEGHLLEFTVTATDPDGDTLTYSTGDLPAGAAFDPETAIFSWLPGYDQAGGYTITFVVDDGKDQATMEVNITVVNVNRAPVFTGIEAQTVVVGNMLEFTVEAVDPDGDHLTYQATSLPAGATFNTLTGHFAWEPTADQVGRHTASFLAADGDLSAALEVPITVLEPGACIPQVVGLSVSPSPVRIGYPVIITADLHDQQAVAGAWYSISGGQWKPLWGSYGERAVQAAATIPATDLPSVPALVGIRVKCVNGEGVESSTAYVALPVYDPLAGPVSGIGSIRSPQGALVAQQLASGIAVFSLAAEYGQSGVAVGEVVYSLPSSGVVFRSGAIGWMITGDDWVLIEGAGTVNGWGGYGFTVYAVDGGKQPQRNGLRLRIWRTSDGGVVYDNCLGSEDYSTDLVRLNGGVIWITPR